MFAVVRLLNGFEKPLWYKIPATLSTRNLIGSVVRVPLQNRKESALVVRQAASLDDGIVFKIKEIIDLEGFPGDENFHAFIEKLSRFYFVEPLHFYQRIRNFLHEADEDDDVVCAPELGDGILPETLTMEQQAVVDYVLPNITTQRYAPTLIHGVTGSGKTEVYKRLIMQAMQEQKTVILILPEVSLSVQFQHALQRQMPTVPIVGFHSATKIAEKRALWQSLLEKKPLLIIGVHLPIILPIANLGLIIVDEEHEHGFQEKKHPKINSKEVALWRASMYQIPIVLGSATPSLQSLANVQRHGWKFFQIKKRFAGAFPEVQKVILTEPTARRRNVFWISRELEQAVRECLARKEQAIIYLNRRGYSFFVQCKSCGYIFECPHCSVSLTLHVLNNRRIKKQENTEPVSLLRCHYCDYNKPLPPTCTGCKADEKQFLKKGIGTQQLVQIFKDVFPGAIIERADLDSTSKKRSWQNTVELFEQGKIDILIGTQTITKGYNFPSVTLVGILWADLNLHFPVYSASETTLQQIIQVAGRAGRYRPQSKVIVQVMHDHPVFNFINEERYLDFCKEELEIRKEIGYPPFGRIVYVELKSKYADSIQHDAERMCEQLQRLNETKNLQVTILGPSFPVVYKIQNYEMRHIVLRSANFAPIHQLLSMLDTTQVSSEVYFIMSS